MNPIYLDVHIHTSDDPDVPNTNYNLSKLMIGVEKYANEQNCLLSITDHNFINEPVYLKAVNCFSNLILGVELHIRNYPEAPSYHCHILFNVPEINADVIQNINKILYKLYPKKRVTNDDDIPRLQDIMDSFDDYDFLLLPHGGQNHSTFNDSIPKGVKFDKTLERSIYYNHFDGFTARSDKSLEKTYEYFDRLGIKEIVHLVTATDNYQPESYPHCKAGEAASEFTPTWMLARPTFDGLRLSLSESSRLKYGDKPDLWSEYIRSAYLKNEKIDIDTKFTPGLNVVIGGSSSGKSLLVDSIVRSINNDFSQSVYSEYDVANIAIDNPTGQYPHYLDQNYISKICDPKDKYNDIQDISLLKNVFPSDSDEREKITNAQAKLARHLSKMIDSVKTISGIYEEVKRIPTISSLIVTGIISANPIKPLEPSPGATDSINYTDALYNEHLDTLDEIDNFLIKHPLLDNESKAIDTLRLALQKARNISTTEGKIREIINYSILVIDREQTSKDREKTTKRKQFEQVMNCIKAYSKAEKEFYEALKAIAIFQLKIETKKIQSMGHTLYIENDFKLNNDVSSGGQQHA
jgi:hypothetical protein